MPSTSPCIVKDDLVDELGLEPLTARSLMLSTLLGTHPPRLPVRALVAVGELFGFAEGTVRTALSRMAASDELDAENGRYSLGERLRRRQASQDASRQAPPRRWDGSWWIAHVVAEGRSVGDRREFRARMRDAHMGELRPDVWLRPANTAGPEPSDDLLLSRGSVEGRDPAALARQLWDLDGLRRTGARLVHAAGDALTSLAAGDAAVLPDTFMVSVAVVRYLLADPQLPVDLVGDHWPADGLRPTYDELERAHGRVLSAFLAQAAAGA
jgi:phenylacetic acid degradation operon negative regulatory protein